jgi:hypothetical protein
LYTQLTKEAFQIKKGRALDLWMGFLLQALVRLVALVPLAALFTPYKTLAFLCPALFILLVLPLRISMADALNAFARGEKLFSIRCVSFKNYFGKLFKGLAQLVKLFLAGLLFIGAAVYLLIMLDQVDMFSSFRILYQLGGGSTITGIMVIVGFAALLCLPMLLTMGFLCADRFFYAMKKAPYKGMRKRYFKVGLLSFILLLPSLAFITAAFFTAMPPFIDSLTRDTSGFKPAFFMLVGALLLYLPTLPVRKLLVPVAVKHEA